MFAYALAFSAVVHTVGIYPKSLYHASWPFRKAGSALYESYQSYKINKERRELIAIARAQIKAGKLELGEFMLKANDLDAREAGEKPDLKRARRKYQEYLEGLRAQMKSGSRVQEAFPKVLKDVKYYGIPSGRMIDAVLDEGGSCEQVSHLSVSLLNDLGYRKQSYLRVYGANADGLGHLAPILKEKGKEYDIVAGRISDGKGTMFPATYLVEAYAKAHGLPYEEFKDKSVGGDSKKQFAKRSGQELTLPNGKPSGFSYPKAKDSYGGGAPLFAKNAFKAFSDNKARSASSIRGNNTANKDPITRSWDKPNPKKFLGVRSVASALLDKKDDRSIHSFVELPSEEKITQLSNLIEEGKGSLKIKMGDWLLAARYATICGLYRELEWNLRIMGMERLAEAANKQRKKLVKLAKGPLEQFLGKKDFKPRTDYSWDHPGYLVYLGKDGEDALFKALEKFSPKEWTSHDGIRYNGEVLAYLIASHAERDKILRELKRLSSEDKMRVLDTLNAVEFDSPDEPYKAFQVYAELDRRINHMRYQRHPAISGIVNQGDSLIVHDLFVKIDEVLMIPGNNPGGVIISILDKNKNIIKKIKLVEGQTQSLNFKGSRSFDLKAEKISPGYTLKTKWADLKIYQPNSGSFQRLVSQIKSECKRLGVGAQWQDVIIASIAFRSAISRNHMKTIRQHPDFHRSFYRWLEGKKEFKLTKFQMQGIFRL
jgi:hypothetical protein